MASIGSAKGHLSRYLMYGGVIAAHREELEPYDTSKTVIRFKPTDPLSAELVRKLIRYRVEQIDSILS